MSLYNVLLTPMYLRASCRLLSERPSLKSCLLSLRLSATGWINPATMESFCRPSALDGSCRRVTSHEAFACVQVRVADWPRVLDHASFVIRTPPIPAAFQMQSASFLSQFLGASQMHRGLGHTPMSASPTLKERGCGFSQPHEGTSRECTLRRSSGMMGTEDAHRGDEDNATAARYGVCCEYPQRL
ncbi:hypothetical protein EXIGLDRAFT_347339 [Exidia glandulosa HHB12029]|uniref:Uncharacterized protein n=1 Tax=Exidia glandulosa HHB12029 TaxID=1314781 RepID=A0A165ZG12_EXIGL|nr:hypothetical protein EXIGLDRAFT_347339 [Exidia glandulosa HHB12029]